MALGRNVGGPFVISAGIKREFDVVGPFCGAESKGGAVGITGLGTAGGRGGRGGRRTSPAVKGEGQSSQSAEVWRFGART